jgi:hypothetical protein
MRWLIAAGGEVRPVFPPPSGRLLLHGIPVAVLLMCGMVEFRNGTLRITTAGRRKDFPEEFEAICLVQDEIGPGSWFLRYRSGPRIEERFPLRDLPEGAAARNEKLPSCSFFCEIAEQDYSS